MEISIHRLNVRYRVAGSGGAAARSRPDDFLRGSVLESLEAALEQALADDGSVYVIRQIRSRMSAPLDGLETPDVVRSLGAQMASAVVRTVAGQTRDSEGFVRFPSQADYVASFVAALAGNRAWDQWYYEPFRDVAPLAAAEAIEAVLLRNREHLPAILARLHASGALASVIGVLPEPALGRIWEAAGRTADRGESLRPLFVTAAELIESCGAALHDREADFQAWLETSPATPNWRDAASLTATVASMLRLLAARCGQTFERRDETDALLARLDWLDAAALRAAIGEILELPHFLRAAARQLVSLLQELQLAAPDLPGVEEIAAGCVRSGCHGSDPGDVMLQVARYLRTRGYIDVRRAMPSEAAIRSVLARTPELDADALSSMLAATLAEDRGVPASRLDGATPTQRALLADLCELLRNGSVAIVPGATESNAIRVYAALVSAFPRWAEPNVPAGLVAATLEKFLASAGEQVSAGAGQGFDTPCAGVFLLLRAIMDAQLARFSTTLSYPCAPHPSAALLAALALRWSGDAGVTGGRLDPAILCFAGEGAPETLAALADVWSAPTPDAHLRFAGELLRMLAAHRLMDGSEMRIARVPCGAGTARVASCGRPDLWPLAALDGDNTADLDWRECWRDATGNDPMILPASEPPPGWDAFAGGALGLLEADLAIAAIANSVLRLWARWLRGFDGASAGYLLSKLVRRPGRVWAADRGITVRLARGELDLVLDMAGYTRDLAPLSSLLPRKIRFQWAP